MSNCEHNWKLSHDQYDTGTNGVRKYCSKCHQIQTFYVDDYTKKVIAEKLREPME